MKLLAHKKTFFWIGTVVLFTIILISFFSHDNLSNDLHGTYSSGAGPNITYFSVDQTKNDVFFYANQSQNIYITGTIHHLSNNSYKLVCYNSENEKIIKNQTIFYQDNAFQITVMGVIEKFQKIDNVPTIFGDINQYH